jgi:hypothetical protein
MDVGTLSQWTAAGISPKRLRTMVRQGDLARLRHGVYVTAAALAATGDDKALRHALEVRAALAATASPDAVASHESAALVHGLPLLHEPSAGTVCLTRSSRAPRDHSVTGVQNYSARLPRGHVTTVNGAPVTTIARTAIDLARKLPFTDAVVVADAAVRWRLGGRPRLRAVIDACEGWPGADQARRVLEFANGLAESPLESRARVLFDASGLPEPELQVQVTAGVAVRADGTFRVYDYHEYRVDFLWREHMTIAETDGKGKYYEAGRTALDELKRDRLLREQGFKIVHITSAELDQHPGRIIDRIRTAFTATSAY